MAVNRKKYSRYGLLWGLLALQVSCSSIHSNVRQKQASDGLSRNGNLLLTAFRATAVAAIRQPVTTTKLGLAILWNRPREIVSGNAPDRSHPATCPRLCPREHGLRGLGLLTSITMGDSFTSSCWWPFSSFWPWIRELGIL